jgi:hypothetical protein
MSTFLCLQFGCRHFDSHLVDIFNPFVDILTVIFSHFVDIFSHLVDIFSRFVDILTVINVDEQNTAVVPKSRTRKMGT